MIRPSRRSATLSLPASRYEREIQDLLGLRAQGHPDPRAAVRHGFWPETYHPLRRDAGPPRRLHGQGSAVPFQQVEGEGSSRSGRPGARRYHRAGSLPFQRDGENAIINMKARLYLHAQGTDKAVRGADTRRGHRPGGADFGRHLGRHSAWPTARRSNPRGRAGARAARPCSARRPYWSWSGFYKPRRRLRRHSE